MTVPRIGVTLGDPGGVGPEIVLKALAGAHDVPASSYILYGDSRLVAEEAKALGLRIAAGPWREDTPARAGLFLTDIPAPGAARARHRPEARNGEASFRFFEAAVSAARAARLDAVVTAPVSKAAWNLAGLPWRGHTDYLESFYPGAIMSFWSDRLLVALFSHHLPLKEALRKIRKAALLDFFRGLARSAGRVEGGPHAFLVPGLNPHAGEDGLLGDEEEGEIRPAIEMARKEGIDISGPYPPDTVFRRALGRRDTLVAALYHDQGLIPFKLEGFGAGANATLGLPFARTSPDHGTAFDIAGKGVADPRSMIEAIRLAGRFTASVS